MAWKTAGFELFTGVNVPSKAFGELVEHRCGTPHIAAGGIEMRREIGAIAVEEVVRFAKGLPPLNRVTSEMLATMT